MRLREALRLLCAQSAFVFASNVQQFAAQCYAGIALSTTRAKFGHLGHNFSGHVFLSPGAHVGKGNRPSRFERRS